jgi:hypothetical protein
LPLWSLGCETSLESQVPAVCIVISQAEVSLMLHYNWIARLLPCVFVHMRLQKFVFAFLVSFYHVCKCHDPTCHKPLCSDVVTAAATSTSNESAFSKYIYVPWFILCAFLTPPLHLDLTARRAVSTIVPPPPPPPPHCIAVAQFTYSWECVKCFVVIPSCLSLYCRTACCPCCATHTRIRFSA